MTSRIRAVAYRLSLNPVTVPESRPAQLFGKGLFDGTLDQVFMAQILGFSDFHDAAVTDNADPVTHGQQFVVIGADENNPFILFEPGNRMHYVSDRRLGPRGLDVPGACNHWPVGHARCDGRSVYSADRPTHFLGFPISDPVIHEKEGRCWWNGLYGMTKRPMKDLVMTARSWVHAPQLVITSPSFESQGYDLSQRAYIVQKKSDNNRDSLKGEIGADSDSPIRNVCLVVNAWGEAGCGLRMDGREVARSSQFRWGHVHRLERTDLVVWIEHESIEKVSFELLPVL